MSSHPSNLRRLPGVPVFFGASSVVSPPQERDRKKISDEYKWDLRAIYASDEAWRAEKDILASELPQLRSFQGALSSSAATLADALEVQSRFEKELTRLFLYASLSSDQDTRVSTYQAMEQQMIQLASALGTEAAFIDLEFQRADVHVLRACSQLPDCARSELGWSQHSGIGVFPADRRSGTKRGLVSSLPATSQAHAGRLRTSLLRLVCAAGFVGQYSLLGARGGGQHPGGPCATRPGVRQRGEALVYRTLD